MVLAYGIVAALVAAFWRPSALWLAAGMTAVLSAINWPLYRFFRAKGGTVFMLGAMAWHGFFYLYGGLAFGIAFTRHWLGRLGRRAVRRRP